MFHIKSFVFVFQLIVLFPIYSFYEGDSCSQNDVYGVCRQLSKCPSLYGEVQAGGSPIPIEMRHKLQAAGCGFYGSEPLVCCLPNQNSVSNIDGFLSDQGHSHNRHNHDHHRHDDDFNWGSDKKGMTNDEYETSHLFTNQVNYDSTTSTDDIVDDIIEPPDVRRHRNLHLLPRHCGTIDEDRIWGGNRTGLFDMPWMVLISYDSGRGTKLSCAGTLITPWYVLTAAHCVSHLGSRMQLKGGILGEHDVRNNPDCEQNEGQLQCAPSAKNVTFDRIIAHPGYTPQNLYDDIALLRLSEPANFSLDNMKPICLPTTTELQNEDLTDKQGVVTGWGATEEGLQSPVLLNVQLPIVSNEECQADYKGNPHIYHRQMCAGGIQSKDSCGGDSGGPLLFPGRSGNSGYRYVQRGIVSFGSKQCGVGGVPGVYTRVAFYMDWILDNISD